MARVIHTADTHIGYRQYHSDERRRDFLTAFESVIADAIDDDVDAVVHAGDLFHDTRPDLRDLQGTIAALRRLADAGVAFYGIVGNHERKRDAQWLDLFADLGLATRLGAEPITVDDVALYGIDYLTPAARDTDAPAFEAPPDGTTTMLVGHGIIEGLPYGDWDLDGLLSTASVDFDAVLLGDYHEHELEHRNGTVVTYSGSTERASATERTPRGYNLISVDDGEVSVTHRTVSDTRRFVFIDVELAAGEGEARVRDRLDEHDLDDAVAIVSIDGAGEGVPAAAIEEHATDTGALVARVRDRRSVTEAAGGDGAEVSVRFGDPDRAVRAALAETTVSEATHELDGLIRDDAIADSNVRERARSLVGDLLADDPEALSRDAEVETPASPPDEADLSADTASTDDERADADEGDDGGADDGQPSAETDEPPADEDPHEPEPTRPAEATADGDGQASMEEFL